MFGEFNEPIITSLAKYSIEFNDLAVQTPSAPNTVFEAVRQTLHIARFFFFKQKTAYEIASCLVGSEMCIRDRLGCLHL